MPGYFQIKTMIQHKTIILPAMGRGFHIVTDEILKALPELSSAGILHLFIKHTSAGLCINENADPTVLEDFESFFNNIVTEWMLFLKHTNEDSDDMRADVKSVLTGHSVTITITDGKLNL